MKDVARHSCRCRRPSCPRCKQDRTLAVMGHPTLIFESTNFMMPWIEVGQVLTSLLLPFTLKRHSMILQKSCRRQKDTYFPHIWPLSSLHFFLFLWPFFLIWFPLLFSTHVCPHHEEQNCLFPTLKCKRIGHSVPEKALGGSRTLF